jgi:hypothetical protein
MEREAIKRFLNSDHYSEYPMLTTVENSFCQAPCVVSHLPKFTFAVIASFRTDDTRKTG